MKRGYARIVAAVKSWGLDGTEAFQVRAPAWQAAWGHVTMEAMKARSGPIAWLIYLVVRMAFAILQVFPIDWNLASARGFARIWPRIMSRHRDRAIAHLRAAYGAALAPDELKRLADRSLESVTMFAVEAACMPRLISGSTWNRYIRISNFEPALEEFLRGRGAILVTGHYGSFEIMGHLLAALDFDIVAVMRPLDNVYLNRFLVQTRRRHGLDLLDKKGAMTHAERVLKEGRLLAFVGDQDAGRKGVFVEFFGQPASTYKSIGLLAMSTGCPIVVAYARRLGGVAKYEVGIQRVILPSEWAEQDDPLRWITQTYTTALEEFVRAEPEQYLWIHRRWKSKPGTVRKRKLAAS